MVLYQQKNASDSLLMQRDENVKFFVSAVPLFFIPCGMHFRCRHIFALLREYPFAAILNFHGNRSAVSSAKLPPCLAPTGNSLKVKMFAYCSASLRL